MSTHAYLEDKRNSSIKIYINGEVLDRKNAKISVFDSGFLLGDGVWEGIRLLNSHLVFLEQHLDRLYSGAEQLEINIGYPKSKLTDLIFETLKSNNMKSDVHIRLIVSRGLKKTPYQHPNANIGPSTIVIIPEYKKANKEINENGISLKLVSTRRGTVDTQDPRLNTLSKLNCIIACIEAKNLGADEGIMLDINDNVSTCNSTNFFIVKNNEIWTSTSEYCLPGITRNAVIEICRENHLKVYEKDFTIYDVESSDEAFVTGTFAGVIPVVKINDKVISKGQIGLTTQLLQKLYKDKLNFLYS